MHYFIIGRCVLFLPTETKHIKACDSMPNFHPHPLTPTYIWCIQFILEKHEYTIIVPCFCVLRKMNAYNSYLTPGPVNLYNLPPFFRFNMLTSLRKSTTFFQECSWPPSLHWRLLPCRWSSSYVTLRLLAPWFSSASIQNPWGSVHRCWRPLWLESYLIWFE